MKKLLLNVLLNEIAEKILADTLKLRCELRIMTESNLGIE